MKSVLIALLAVSMVAVLPACSNGGGNNNNASSSKAKSHLKTQRDKFSYAVGMDIGNSLHSFKKKLEPDELIQGLRDKLHGKKTLLSKKEKQQVIQAYVAKLQKQRSKKRKAEAKTNAKKSKQFLAKKAKQKGVKTTASGLEYKVLKQGDGPKPTKNDVVTVKYKGKLPNGKVFDSSYKRGKPATFPVGGVIPGWSEALQMMPEGSKYRLFIPPKLAYGKHGAGRKIGPNQALIFDVDLIKIKKQGSGNSGASASGSSAGNEHSSASTQ